MVSVQSFMSIFAIFATVLMLNGCSTTPAYPVSPAQDSLPTNGYPAVTMERSIKDGLVVDYRDIVFQSQATLTPTSVQVPVRSSTKYSINVQYQFSWFDKQDRFLNTSGWKFIVMPSGQERFFQSTATNSLASGWRLEIRSAR